MLKCINDETKVFNEDLSSLNSIDEKKINDVKSDVCEVINKVFNKVNNKLFREFKKKLCCKIANIVFRKFEKNKVNISEKLNQEINKLILYEIKYKIPINKEYDPTEYGLEQVSKRSKKLKLSEDTITCIVNNLAYEYNRYLNEKEPLGTYIGILRKFTPEQVKNKMRQLRYPKKLKQTFSNYNRARSVAINGDIIEEYIMESPLIPPGSVEKKMKEQYLQELKDLAEEAQCAPPNIEYANTLYKGFDYGAKYEEAKARFERNSGECTTEKVN
jgi:hypothetical protein